MSHVCSKSFLHLRQLRRVRSSLDSDSASTLVHAFVTTRVDYCNAVLAGATKATTGRLQRVLNAAARVVSNTRKLNDPGLQNLMHIDLHWLDVLERVTYKLSVMVDHCLHGTAPKFLSELCTLVADVASRRQLRFASQNVQLVPRHKLSGLGRRAFRVAGPLVWNSIADCLRDPAFELASFKRQLKTFFFARYRHNVWSALEML